ncbi:hypothetical protein FSP39_016211 [Pinctada imbricata]|uniref:Uncharacterized protein n=1 Tax=Pinctada imbricata TaxID=66713 RepID=A0AA88YMT4_PINIB|nr:hypothetical protein FSP39_016211 [Pinctada imbricata]
MGNRCRLWTAICHASSKWCGYPGLRAHNPLTSPITQRSRRTYNCGVKQPPHYLNMVRNLRLCLFLGTMLFVTMVTALTPFPDEFSADRQLQLFASETDEALLIDKQSQDILSAEAKLFKHRLPILTRMRIKKEFMKLSIDKCPYRTAKGGSSCPKDKYRTYDGSCNNLAHPEWGKSFTPQARYLPAKYDDGFNSSRIRSVNGGALPSPRVISNNVFSSRRPPLHPSQSIMVMAWGQFLDHDVVKTPQSTGAREQINSITSYIDASNVYGSTKGEADKLREMRGGRMKVSSGDLLPDIGKPVCKPTGDGRVNVILNLGAHHILFVREHNRLVGKLAVKNPKWDDERLYQEARKIVAAYMQHFTYNEYLPVILGHKVMKDKKLPPVCSGKCNRYNSKVNPTVRNVFGVAAFRFGHSQITNVQALANSRGRIFKVRFTIEECFHDPGKLQKNKCKRACPGITNWMVNHKGGATDGLFDPGVRDKLFQTNQTSLDLVSLNIQRGRDHGIPSYTEWRKFLNLTVPSSFCDLNTKGSHTKQNAKLLSQTYSHVKDIDLFAGAMTEENLPGASVGPVFAGILSEQFLALKEGDRFWYENGHDGIGFNKDQINAIKRMTLAKILCENMKTRRIQKYVMMVPNRKNPRVRCSSLEDLDLTLWKEKDDHYRG